jgi:hypothetical protein
MRAATLALCAALAGCGHASTGPAPLGAPWPEHAASYDDAYHRWTRSDEDRTELIQTLSVSATLFAPEFRAAYLRERARRLGIPADEEARLAADERRAADETWEVELLVATAKPEWNDLRKWGKEKPDGRVGSMWRLSLVGDGGRSVGPVSVKEDRRHREDVAYYFPELRQFYQAYSVRFPKTASDGQPLLATGGSGKLALIVGGSQGHVELVWTGQ